MLATAGCVGPCLLEGNEDFTIHLVVAEGAGEVDFVVTRDTQVVDNMSRDAGGPRAAVFGPFARGGHYEVVVTTAASTAREEFDWAHCGGLGRLNVNVASDGTVAFGQLVV